MKWFKNGKIYSEKGQFHDSMLVDDERIVKVGSGADCQMMFNGEEIVDLKGRTVIPGLIDSHLHFLMTAEYLSLMPITDVTSMKELISRCTDYIEKNQLTKGDVLYTEGWNHTLFTDKIKVPDRHDLDKASQTVPIVLVRVDRHMMSLNTAALNYFGLNSKMKRDEGGELEVDDTGELTGVLKETALDLVKAQLPEKSREDRKHLLVNTMALANRYGITSMHTNDAKDEQVDDTLSIYEELEKEDQLSVRFYHQIWFNDSQFLPSFLSGPHQFHKGTDWNRIGPIKYFIDGTLGSRTAALFDPYSDDETTRGIHTKSQEALNQEVKLAVDNGFQVITHGIGDRGINMILDAYDEALGDNKNDLRLGINHMQITSHELIDRVASKNYLTYVQPLFLEDDLLILYDRVGKERAETSYLFNTMKNKGIHQSFSSDAPIVSFNPFDTIHCAVTRNRLTESLAEPFLAEEAMTVEEAIDAYTVEGAYASFDEDKKGRLKEGFLADFVILNEDIFTIEKSSIKNVTVAATYVNGKAVYTREESIK